MRERVTVVCLSFVHSFIQSVTHSTRISKMADLREDELRLDDNLSPFNQPLFKFQKREKWKTMVKATIRPHSLNSLAGGVFQVCLLSTKCALSVVQHVRKPKFSCGFFFSTKPKLTLKPDNAMKSSESRKTIWLSIKHVKQLQKVVWISPRSVKGWFQTFMPMKKP